MNEHTFHIWNGNTKKSVSEHINFPGHFVMGLKITNVEKRNYRDTREETVEVGYINKFQCIPDGLNKDQGLLAHYIYCLLYTSRSPRD